LPFAPSLRQEVNAETATIRLRIDPIWLEPTAKTPDDEPS